jgi:hypothetical protein
MSIHAVQNVTSGGATDHRHDGSIGSIGGWQASFGHIVLGFHENASRGVRIPLERAQLIQKDVIIRI